MDASHLPVQLPGLSKMSTPQPGILAPVPSHSRYLEFGTVNDLDPVMGLQTLASRAVDEETVIGIGPGLVARLKQSVDGLRPFPALSGPGCDVPSTQADLWCWIRGTDRGEITHRGRSIIDNLGRAFRCDRLVDGFCYGESRDLTGYIDGTENPTGDDAVNAAITQGVGLDGGSFVAVQQWQHDLDYFKAMPQTEQDNIFGRRLSDNEEMDDAPPSAHVKRTAQESFDPEAFVVRRSMPWADSSGEGLMFVAFGASLYAYDALLRRMVGEEDGIVDGLFRFSRPLSGSYFWCPPVNGGKLDLSAIGM
jgi:putative iron-dependent peroxidase